MTDNIKDNISNQNSNQTSLQHTEISKIPTYPMLLKMEKFLSGAVPNDMCAKRLIRLFFVELNKNPTLNACSPDSIYGAIMTCAQIGLEPGLAGMLYLIPRGGKVTVQLGYRGMIELSHRSGRVSTIKSYSVYENDECEVQMGTEDKIVHRRTSGPRGRMTGVYAVITMKDGSKHFDFMSIEEVECIRRKYSNSNNQAWANEYAQMAQKTVIKRILKYAPTSVTLSAAITLDDAGEYEGQDLASVGRVALIEAGIIDMETGEVKSQSDTLADKLSESEKTSEV